MWVVNACRLGKSDTTLDTFVGTIEVSVVTFLLIVLCKHIVTDVL